MENVDLLLTRADRFRKLERQPYLRDISPLRRKRTAQLMTLYHHWLDRFTALIAPFPQLL
jgi:hypothetical protein